MKLESLKEFMSPLAGPDSFSRAVGAKKLEGLISTLDRDAKAAAFNRLLPTLLLFLDDPTPFVQAMGIQTLHNLTQGTTRFPTTAYTYPLLHL